MAAQVTIAVCFVVGAVLFWLASLRIIGALDRSRDAMGRYRQEAEASRKANLLLYDATLRVAGEVRGVRDEAVADIEAARDEALQSVAQFVHDFRKESA